MRSLCAKSHIADAASIHDKQHHYKMGRQGSGWGRGVPHPVATTDRRIDLPRSRGTLCTVLTATDKYIRRWLKWQHEALHHQCNIAVQRMRGVVVGGRPVPLFILMVSRGSTYTLSCGDLGACTQHATCSCTLPSYPHFA